MKKKPTYSELVKGNQHLNLMLSEETRRRNKLEDQFVEISKAYVNLKNEYKKNVALELTINISKMMNAIATIMQEMPR